MRDDRFTDRILQELDACSSKIEELALAVAESALLLKILSRLVFCIVLAMITGSIALGYDTIKKKAEQTGYHNTTVNQERRDGP